jgi:hypothetical protein
MRTRVHPALVTLSHTLLSLSVAYVVAGLLWLRLLSDYPSGTFVRA